MLRDSPYVQAIILIFSSFSDIVPGRMTLLVTVFLVLVNIFNTITTNIPKASAMPSQLRDLPVVLTSNEMVL